MSFEPLGLRYKHQAFEGVPLTGFITPERLEEIRDVHINRPDDIYIATSLKCGTTWLQQILCLMFDFPQGKQENINMDIPWLEQATQAVVDGAKSPRIFKTHLKWRWMPKGDEIRYIYCYRNPKDVVVSYYHHMQTFKYYYTFDGTFDNFVSDVFLAENAAENGSYFDHVAEWLEQSNNKNILFMTYEDMTEDLEREVKRIASFLNIELKKDKLSLITGESNFETMKNSDRTNYSWMNHAFKDPKCNFIRKGKVGDWVNYLSEEQSNEIEKRVNERLIPLGARIKYHLE